MPRGGKRPHSGPKKGAIYKPTLEKAAARELVRQYITDRLTPMLDAQYENAKGLKYLIVRDKRSGKFLRVTEAMAKVKQQQLAETEEVIEVWEKDPSVQAFTDLLNRALDKPPEQVKLTGPEGGPVKVQWADGD